MKNARAKILKELEAGKPLGTSFLAERLGISRQATHRHLATLVREGKALRLGSGQRDASYLLNKASVRGKVFGRGRTIRRRVRTQGLAEDRLLAEVTARAGLLDGLSLDARANFDFGFTEMVNNAIDHSRSKMAEIVVSVDPRRASFVVADTGIGVFESIRAAKELANEMEAIQDLLKGKVTTSPERHSGEGIFFTSRAADRFVLESHGKRLTVDNVLNDLFVEDVRFRKGTRVSFSIAANSRRDLAGIFKEYTGEDFAFDKTRVTVRLFQSGDAYVSRSQAKRLLHSLERFREVTLDFRGVPTVGQAFADEVFRVFQQVHPEITIAPENMNENVAFMVRRALSEL